jgi:hypothetical protein
VDVVDAHFAGRNTIHDLIEARVFDFQCISNQGAYSGIDAAVGCEFSSASLEIGVECARFLFAR